MSSCFEQRLLGGWNGAKPGAVEQFRALLVKDIAIWAKTVKAAGIKMN